MYCVCARVHVFKERVSARDSNILDVIFMT